MPKVIPLDLAVEPEAAVSGALLLQTEYSTVLSFNAVQRQIEGPHVPVGTAVLRFRHCLRTKFGLPNDEALAGHPLHAHGLGWYGCWEVLDSPWRAEAERENSVSFPTTDYSQYRHFVFTFHDSSFECLALDSELRIVPPGAFRADFDLLVDRAFSE